MEQISIQEFEQFLLQIMRANGPEKPYKKRSEEISRICVDKLIEIREKTLSILS